MKLVHKLMKRNVSLSQKRERSEHFGKNKTKTKFKKAAILAANGAISSLQKNKINKSGIKSKSSIIKIKKNGRFVSV